MPYSGMLHSVALVRTDVPEEPSASIIRVTRIVELGNNAEKKLYFLGSYESHMA
jgi:hypothetical protein